MVDVAIRDMRRIATALRPAVLDFDGLVDTIRFLAEDFERRTAIPCAVCLPEKLLSADLPGIPDERRKALGRNCGGNPARFRQRLP